MGTSSISSVAPRSLDRETATGNALDNASGTTPARTPTLIATRPTRKDLAGLPGGCRAISSSSINSTRLWAMESSCMARAYGLIGHRKTGRHSFLDRGQNVHSTVACVFASHHRSRPSPLEDLATPRLGLSDRWVCPFRRAGGGLAAWADSRRRWI